MLSSLIKNSEILATAFCAKNLDKTISNQVPQIAEIFSIFHQAFLESNQSLNSIEDIPIFPKNIKEIKAGIYKKNEKLVAFTNVPKGYLGYLIPYSIGIYAHTGFSKEDSGLLMASLTIAKDGIHYEPESFIYIFRNDFFNKAANEYIVPFLSLSSTIPDHLLNHWVYLAMRKLNNDFCSDINYKYLVIDPKEVSELEKMGLYN